MKNIFMLISFMYMIYYFVTAIEAAYSLMFKKESESQESYEIFQSTYNLINYKIPNLMTILFDGLFATSIISALNKVYFFNVHIYAFLIFVTTIFMGASIVAANIRINHHEDPIKPANLTSVQMVSNICVIFLFIMLLIFLFIGDTVY